MQLESGYHIQNVAISLGMTMYITRKIYNIRNKEK